MSETNTQLIKRGYELFGAGDLEGLLGLFAEDIQWTVPTVENAPFIASRAGKESVARFFNQLLENEQFTEFAPVDFIAEGDRVVVIGRSSAIVKTTGRSFSTQWVHIFTVKGGKITAFLEFLDTAAASRAFQKAASA